MGTIKTIGCLLVIGFLSGCVSIADINVSTNKIEKTWLLDYQKTEEALRTRVIDAPSLETFTQVKKALVSIDLPVTKSSLEDGEVWAQGIAPAPLSQQEWEEVAEKESPRVKELSGGLLYLKDDPSDYVLTVKITLRAIDRKTLVVIDYLLSAPKFEAYGINMPKVAPPEAVLIGSAKFWDALERKLQLVDIPKPRRANPDELGA